MINDDVIKKWILSHPSSENNDFRLHEFKKNLLRIKLNFKGIGNRHLSLIGYKSIKRGDKIIWDYYLDINKGKDNVLVVPPKMFQIVSSINQGDDNDLGILLGCGSGEDYSDPSLKLSLGMTYSLRNLKDYPVVLRLDSMGRYGKFKGDLRTIIKEDNKNGI